ncbi:unknown [Crocosphaera subtropica ATCC 51142]|uniref:Uncharacterized protein n=1 Tax=Crocosphaera subtropica (strain ATCC 51142 / BH68) TaxID=43989 RepID=B1WY70_CROS5|nr:hypothetical protein [Crocosphaera subtropica]ACB52654.1 unknown [Crocosphaera subtropica ATCC 51142]
MNDRKKRILEHLKQSTNGTQYISPKNTSNPTPTPPPTPEPIPEPKPVSKPTLKEDRKQKIMAHVNTSSQNFGSFSLKDDSKKKKIEEHIRKSLS